MDKGTRWTIVIGTLGVVVVSQFLPNPERYVGLMLLLTMCGVMFLVLKALAD